MNEWLGSDQARALVRVGIYFFGLAMGSFLMWATMRLRTRDRDALKSAAERHLREIEEKDGEISILKSYNDALGEEHAESVDIRNRKILELTGELGKKDCRLNDIENERCRLSNEVGRLGQALENMLESREAARKDRHEAIYEVSSLKNRVSYLEAENDRLGESLRKSTDARDEAMRAKAQVESLSKALHDCTMKFAKVSAERQSLSERIESLEATNSRAFHASHETARIRSTLEKLADERAWAISENNRLREQLAVSNVIDLPFKRLSETAIAPTKAYDGDAAYDLYADQDAFVGAVSTVINTNIAIAIPDGYGVLLMGRSSHAKTSIHPLGFVFPGEGMIRLGGVIDSGYRGPLRVMLASLSPGAPNRRIEQGEAIAQIWILPVPPTRLIDVGDEELPPSVRGERWDGSSNPPREGTAVPHDPRPPVPDDRRPPVANPDGLGLAFTPLGHEKGD